MTSTTATNNLPTPTAPTDIIQEVLLSSQRSSTIDMMEMPLPADLVDIPISELMPSPTPHQAEATNTTTTTNNGPMFPDHYKSLAEWMMENGF